MILTEEDFEIIESTYKNNINKGKTTVEIHGTGEWGGRKTLVFSISAECFLTVSTIFIFEKSGALERE